MRKGLTNDIIRDAAAKLVAEKGYRNFSIRELAARLGVAPSSLYSHVDGISEIGTAVGMVAIERLSSSLEKAIDVEDRDAAFIGFARAYRCFAHENPELYRAIIDIPGSDDELLSGSEPLTIAPLRKVIGRFVSDENGVVDFQRFTRSAMHGFIDLEAAGFMRNPGISADESYEMLIATCLDALKRAADG